MQNLSAQPAILLLDNHLFAIDFYKKIIASNTSPTSCDIIVSQNCEKAYQQLLKAYHTNFTLTLAILDIQVPSFEEFNSGGDIAVLIKKLFPHCKILIVTSFTEPLIIYNLLKEVSVEAILSKSDIGFEEFNNIYNHVISGHTFFSESIKKKITKIEQNRSGIDDHDLEILQKLNEGYKTADLTKHIHLSLSAIEKRKANLKRVFLKNGGNDKDLIEKIKEIGLL